MSRSRFEHLSKLFITSLTVVTLIAVMVTLVYVAALNRAEVRRNAQVMKALERAQIFYAERASEERAATAKRDEQNHAAQINQLRRGQYCLGWVHLEPTAAWNDETLIRCLLTGVLPRGIGGGGWK